MVCQAASQTRFRALKHENGIAGSATIIVRVIACFQPLQDCQVSGDIRNFRSIVRSESTELFLFHLFIYLYVDGGEILFFSVCWAFPG